LNRYFIIYKPFGMLSQFTAEGNKPTLSELFGFPKDVYPVGRLDSDSEGLLILTNDKELNHRLLNPKFQHPRTYLAQVEGVISQDALMKLRMGLTITIDGKPYQTLPSIAEMLTEEPELPERNPPVRFRKSIPTSWLKLTLHEGKNRQVRKMTAAVGYPTLRLVRIEIGNVFVGKMSPGEIIEIEKNKLFSLLF
jgi:23S rRNA pseudouridine2457 synthase